MGYHTFKDESGEAIGSFETFQIEEYESVDYAAGWHWWACFPGCIPDGDPCGPFDTEQEAIADAQS